MKVAMFSGYWMPHIGGLEVAVDNLSRYLQDHGHEVVEVRLPSWDAAGVFTIPKRLAFPKCDLVVTNTRFFLSSLVGLMVAWIRGVPLVHIEHGSCHPVLSSPVVSMCARIYDHTLGALVIRCARKVICQSEMARNFVVHLGMTWAKVLPLTSVDTHAFCPELRRTNNHLTVMGLGRSIYAKGSQDVFAIFDKVREVVPNVQLEWISDIPHRDIPAVLSRADILVHCSYSEGGVAYPILEAGAMGIPAVVSDVGAVRDVLTDGETALIYPAGDKTALADCLIRLLKDETLREKIGTAARQLVLDKYSLDRVCAAIEEAIEE
jgi:glycosyltransferase involved in cell wall biosynthesis